MCSSLLFRFAFLRRWVSDDSSLTLGFALSGDAARNGATVAGAFVRANALPRPA